MAFEPKPFGKYFLIEKIAVGGMAEIYKAKTFGVDGFEKLLAIKKILPHYSSDKEFISMLTDEAKLVVRLSHTNIVQIYDLGKVGDDYFISMEFIDGINLREILTKAKDLKEKIPLPLCLYIASEICQGLDYAHMKRDDQNKSLGIVHRDVSPQNILISFEGETKIVDFGIAKAAMNVSNTNAGILKGKITYMSPEQALGKPIDHRTDIFSTGIILYEMITGERLFSGDTQFEVLKKIRSTQINETNLKDKVPPEIQPILAKALSYNVNERFQTAGDFQVALTRMLYSQYHEFSPKQLSELIRRWYKKELEVKQKLAQKQSAISTKQSKGLDDYKPQTSLVNPEDSEDLFLPDTMRPEGHKPQQFKSSDVIDGSHQSEEIITRSSKTRPPQFKPKQNIMWVFIGLGLLIALLIYFLPSDFISQNSDTKKDLGSIDSEFDDAELFEIKTGTVVIKTNPDKATLKIDGEVLIHKTPHTIDELELGKTYRLEISKKGYQTLVEDLKLNDTQPLTMEKELQKINELTQKEITSQPEGARIFIDGVDTGFTTPSKIESLYIGQEYTLTLKLDEYKDFETTFIPEKDQPALQAQLQLVNQLGNVFIKSNVADAKIMINEEVISNKTEPKSLQAGRYVIKVTASGYEPYEEEISVVAGDKLEILVNLNPIQAETKIGKLTITSEPTGALVTINGKNSGTTPLSIETTQGTKNIVLTKQGYQTYRRSIQVGESRNLSASLFKEEEKVQNTDYTLPSSVRIDSNPRGASVIFNGSKAGITPVVIPNVDPSITHTVVLDLPGYKQWTKTFKVSQNRIELMAKLNRE